MSLRRPKISPTKIAVMRKQDEALRLHLAGASLADIARTLEYYDASGAWKAIVASMGRLGEQQRAFLVRSHELRLDELLLHTNRIIANPGPLLHNGRPAMVEGPDGQIHQLQDQRVKIMAIREARKTMESMRKLSGLDAPTKVELTGEDGGPIEIEGEIIARIRARAEQQQAIAAAARDSDDLPE